MDANRAFDATGQRAARVERLRSAVAAGTYRPDADEIAESLVGWIATPAQFERPVKFSDDGVDRKTQAVKDHDTRR